MARLTALPSLDIIRRFAGVLDFYLWRGLPCVRAWPRYRPARQTAGSKASATLFADIIKGYNLVGDIALAAYREAAAGTPIAARDVYLRGVLGHLHLRTEAPPPPPPEEQMYDAYVCLRDLKAQGAPGGSFSAGAWRTRDLTEEQADQDDICTLVANQFVLAAGTYRAIISCPAHRVVNHRAHLYNVTAAAVVLLGTSEYAHSTYYGQTRSFIVGRFTIAAAQTLEIQHRSYSTKTISGFGVPTGYGQEVYTTVELWRETEP